MKDSIQFIKDQHIEKVLARKINTFGNTQKEEIIYGAVSKIMFDNLKIKNEYMAVGGSRTHDYLQSLEFIVVHDTGNNNLGANGEMHTKYLHSGPKTSWHYTVDEKGAFRHLPNNEVGFHAGDGLRPFGLNDTGIKAETKKPNITISSDGYYELNRKKSFVKAPLINGEVAKTEDLTPTGVFVKTGRNGNYYLNHTYYNNTYKVIANQGGGTSGIGIESCVDEGSNLYSTWQNLAKLVAKLLIENNLGLDRVMQHNHFSGKNCPQTLRTASLWNYFMGLVEAEYNLLKNFHNFKFTFKSNNPEIINNAGRVISPPAEDLEVTFTITITNVDYHEDVTLTSLIPGFKKL